MPGIDLTIDVLKRHSTHASVVTHLAAGLTSRSETVQRKVAVALIEMNSPFGHLELLRHVEMLPSDVIASISENLNRFERVIREGTHRSAGTSRNQLLRSLRILDAWQYAGHIVSSVGSDVLAPDDLGAQVAQGLVYSLWDHRPQKFVDSRAWETARSSCEAALIEQIRGHSAHLEIWVELLLIVGHQESEQMHRALWHTDEDVRSLAAQLLKELKHPGVFQFIIESLKRPYPSPSSLAAIAQRDDLEFICYFLAHLPQPLSGHFAMAIRQLQDVPWVESTTHRIQLLPENLQPAFIRLIENLGHGADERRRLLEWIVRKGAPLAKRIAAERLNDPRGEEFVMAVEEGLFSSDTAIQTWATEHLRLLGAAEAMPALLEQLNSPAAEVRNAARRQLSDFTVEKVLENLSHIEPSIGPQIGELLVLLDEHAIDRLRHIMSQANGAKRLNAMKAIRLLDWGHLMMDSVLDLASEDDATLRRASIELLGESDDPRAQSMLEILADDISPRVAQAAMSALKTPRIPAQID